MKRAMLTLMLAALIACQSEQAVADSPGRARALFTQGKTLIENNCGDCRGGTRAGLETGIETMRQAIELGYPNKAEAYKLLTQAYNTLALVYAEPDSAEQKKVQSEQRELYRQLIELDPNDAAIRVEYAILAEDPYERLMQLRQAVEVAPKFAEARFVLAATLIERGDWESGTAEARTAIAQAQDADAAARYGRRIGELLTIAGRPQEAALVEAEARQKAGARQ